MLEPIHCKSKFKLLGKTYLTVQVINVLKFCMDKQKNVFLINVFANIPGFFLISCSFQNELGKKNCLSYFSLDRADGPNFNSFLSVSLPRTLIVLPRDFISPDQMRLN